MRVGSHVPTRCAVVIGAMATACHLASIGNTTTSPVELAISTILAVACILCSIGLWRMPTDHSATAMLVVTLLMLIGHAIMPAFGGHLHGSSDGTETQDSGDAADGVILFNSVVLELGVVMILSLWLRSIHRVQHCTALPAEDPGYPGVPEG